MDADISPITKRDISDREIASYLLYNDPQIPNYSNCMGLTALHTAASVGRVGLVQWLLKFTQSDVDFRDLEGWTALHRAVFYGHIDAAVRLVQNGADLFAPDPDKLSPLDICTLDLFTFSKVLPDCMYDLYVWGSNTNYTIGIGTDNERKHPEMLNFFKKNGYSITEVKMNELHSVFLSSCGSVFSCGHGMGGRLGTGSEKSVVTPVQIKFPTGEKCTDIDTGLNHTLFLLESGAVLTCGLNSHHQLGLSNKITSCPSPRHVPLSTKVNGICAGKYHSVFYNSDCILTCGLNGGQLGHTAVPSDPYVTKPTIVTTIPKVKIHLVATSAGALVFSSTAGDVFLLHQFKCRKLFKFKEGLEKISVVGGSIQTSTVTENEPLKIVILTQLKVYLWEEQSSTFASCTNLGQGRIIVDAVLLHHKILVVSSFGDAYIGALGTVHALKKPKETKEKSNRQMFPITHHCHVAYTRIPNVHRATSITADPKGKNFAVIQVHPRSNISVTIDSRNAIPQQLRALLKESSELDSLHDFILEGKGVKHACHKYILGSRSSYFAEVIENKTSLSLDCQPVVLEQLLAFIYCGACDDLRSWKEEQMSQLYKVASRCNITNMKNQERNKVDENIKFDRLLFPELYDVTIVPESGASISAHKCILAARLEYFHSMFLCGWAESGNKTRLTLPFPESVVRDVIDFIYTDEAPANIYDDTDHAMKVLAAADHLLVNKLKEICELSLVPTISPKNALSLLVTASAYNASQLKQCVLDFMVHNIKGLLEGRTLEALDDATLKQISQMYQKYNEKNLSTRVITPHLGPSTEEILEVPLIDWPDNFCEVDPIKPKPAKKEPAHKKKTPKKSMEKAPLSVDKEKRPQEELDVKIQSPPAKPALPLMETPPITPERVKEEEPFRMEDFPGLDGSSFPRRSTPLKIRYEGKRAFLPRVSQKQRKKSTNEEDEPPSLKSPLTSPKTRAWAAIEPLPVGSPTEDPFMFLESPKPSDQSFSKIIAEAKIEKDNLIRMKQKPFSLTQLEDKAIEDLLRFYKADKSFDERIHVERVLPCNIAQPTWTKSSK